MLGSKLHARSAGPHSELYERPRPCTTGFAVASKQGSHYHEDDDSEEKGMLLSSDFTWQHAASRHAVALRSRLTVYALLLFLSPVVTLVCYFARNLQAMRSYHEAVPDWLTVPNLLLLTRLPPMLLGFHISLKRPFGGRGAVGDALLCQICLLASYFADEFDGDIARASHGVTSLGAKIDRLWDHAVVPLLFMYMHNLFPEHAPLFQPSFVLAVAQSCWPRAEEYTDTLRPRVPLPKFYPSHVNIAVTTVLLGACTSAMHPQNAKTTLQNICGYDAGWLERGSAQRWLRWAKHGLAVYISLIMPSDPKFLVIYNVYAINGGV